MNWLLQPNVFEILIKRYNEMTRGAFLEPLHREMRRGERRAERHTERDGEIARERKSTTQGSFWGRGRIREGEKRIRPIETWHDRVSEDGCLCISHCVHQRHRNTTHIHSASSYKLHCSLIKAMVRTAAISREPFPFMVGGSHSPLDEAPFATLEYGQRKLILLAPVGGKITGRVMSPGSIVY